MTGFTTYAVVVRAPGVPTVLLGPYARDEAHRVAHLEAADRKGENATVRVVRCTEDTDR